MVSALSLIVVLNLAKIAVSCRDRGCLGKILVFSSRSHLSRRDLASLDALLKSRRESHQDLAEIFNPQKKKYRR